MKYGNEIIYRTIPWIVLYIYICIVFVYFVYFSSYNLLDIALISTFVSVCVQSSLHLWVSWCRTPVSHWLRLLSSIKAALFVFAVPLVSCCCISGLVHHFSSFPTRSTFFRSFLWPRLWATNASCSDWQLMFDHVRVISYFRSFGFRFQLFASFSCHTQIQLNFQQNKADIKLLVPTNPDWAVNASEDGWTTLLIRPSCSIWMRFLGIYYVAREPDRLEGGSDFIFRLFFKLREGSSVSASSSVLRQWKLREWVVNQQCFSKCMQALIITGRALF